MLRRFLDLLRVVIRSAGWTAIQRAAPLYLGILVVSPIIFAKFGMRAADITTLCASSPRFRLGLWTLWMIGATPAARTVLCEPALFLLRALPVPRWHFYVTQGFLLFLAEGPWMALFLRGAGLFMGLAVGVIAMAGHALYASGSRRPLVLLTGGVLVLTVAGSVPAVPSLFLGVVALRIGIAAAFRHAPERDVGSGRPLLAGPRMISLSLAYLLTLWRSHAALLWRAVFFLMLGAAVTTLALRNNEVFLTESRSTLFLGVLTAPLLLSACGLSGPVLRSERQARWLLDVCGVGPGLRVLSAALPVALLGALLGELFALAVGFALSGPPALLFRLSLDAVVGGASLGFVASGCVRWAQRGDKKDSNRVLLSMLGCIIAAAVLTWALHEMVLGVFILTALWLSTFALRAARPQGRWLRLRQERQQGELR